jgi:2-hydroxy-3-oxopropionate reductase
MQVKRSHLMPPVLGFIGLGIMGKPMALNLLRAGYPLHVFARRAQAAAPLIDAGAVAARGADELAAASDVVLTMVSDTPDVRDLVLRADGILAGASAGTVLVDMSTISATVTRQLAAQLAEKGVEMLDAPVSGGEQGAVEGALSIMVGGEEATFRRVLPILQVLGKNIVHIGGHGAGQVAKTCNQVLVAQAITAVAEALLLARRAGVDPARVREALLGGFARSRILEVHGERMLRGDYAPGFKAKLHQKDMRIAQEMAHELGIGIPGAALSAQYLNALVGSGEGELDSAAIYRVLARLTQDPAEKPWESG